VHLVGFTIGTESGVGMSITDMRGMWAGQSGLWFHAGVSATRLAVDGTVSSPDCSVCYNNAAFCVFVFEWQRVVVLVDVKCLCWGLYTFWNWFVLHLKILYQMKLCKHWVTLCYCIRPVQQSYGFVFHFIVNIQMC